MHKSRSLQKTAGGRGHGSKSEAVRERAILALMAQPSITAAAAAAGISERTIRRWQADDSEFVAALDRARSLAFDEGLGLIKGLTTKAVMTLQALLDQTEYPTARLGAARALLDLAISQHQIQPLLSRLADVERQLDVKGER